MSAPVATLPPGEHLDLLLEAIHVEGQAQQRLLEGDWEAGRPLMRQAADLYRASWELAPPRSFGRLVGMLKAAIIGEVGRAAADYAAAQQLDLETPTAAYASALVALVRGDDDAARPGAAAMRSGSDAFHRASDAIGALASGDGRAYLDSITAIVRDFEARDAHLTGVAIADTAIMLQKLAGPRGLAAAIPSPVLPPQDET